LALIGLSLILAWLDMGLLNYDQSSAGALEALNGGEPYKAICVFPPLLIYVTLVLGSPVTLRRFGAILIGLLIWKIGFIRAQTWQRVWTA